MTPQRQEGGRGILRLRAATNRFAIRKQKESRPFAQNDHKGTKHRAALPPQTGRGGLRLTRRGRRAKLSARRRGSKRKYRIQPKPIQGGARCPHVEPVC